MTDEKLIEAAFNSFMEASGLPPEHCTEEQRTALIRLMKCAFFTGAGVARNIAEDGGHDMSELDDEFNSFFYGEMPSWDNVKLQ